MVTATGIRNALLESAVNPSFDPLIRQVIEIGTPDYLRIKAVEVLRRLDVPAENGLLYPNTDVCEALEEAITLLAVAKAKLTPPAKKKARRNLSEKQTV